MDKLVARLQKGDDAAFEEFVSQYEKSIYTLALRQLGSPHDAQDAAQEVFLRVYRGIRRFRADAKLSTWVYQITLNVCIDMMRKKSRHPELSLVLPDNDGGETEMEQPDESYAPEPLYERTELRDEVRGALAKLSPEHRRIVILRDITGLSYEEIAGVLRLTEGTVKSRLFRARDKLAAILREGGNKSACNASKISKADIGHAGR
ncbi:MAG: sigma-70 family RNA polymerase sigma factor [Clostridiaceae bacterium]|nr:sigma-70 family RNA polymerase sigma factor [Clostridiaceae bacterium]